MIWVIGSRGMFGREFCRMLGERGIRFTGTDLDVSVLDKAALAAFAAGTQPSWIINCSAYTAVDRAEDEPEAAFALNRDGPANLAEVAAGLDIPLVHISTDYVFDGESSLPLSEDAPVSPRTVYGQSKLEGEAAVARSCRRHFVIRTAWLYGQYGSNFVSTMLKLMNERPTVRVVNDQIGSPTWTRVLAEFICRIIESVSDAYGVYHLSGEGRCSWFEFAGEILRLGLAHGLLESRPVLEPCGSADFAAKATRPKFSLLSKEKALNTFGYSIPDWKDSLESYFLTLI